MFEREIKFIYDFNLNKVKKAGAFLTFEQLLSADLHPAIMQYISAEIDYLIFEDRQKMLKNSAFDYSGGKITQYFNLINLEVKKSKRFSSEYITKLILHASSFTVNFLIRPKWSLLKFIFDDDESKTAAEIKQILNYLYYYGYLKNILISYLDKKKVLTMTKDEFAELLDKIEKLGIETYLDDVINTALKSMAEFFNIGSTQKSKVPLPGIGVFLNEKKLTQHINKLNENFGKDEKLNQEIADIQKVLISVRVSNENTFEELREEDIEDNESRLDDEVIETFEETEKDQKYVADYSINNDGINEESDELVKEEETEIANEDDPSSKDLVETVEEETEEVIEEKIEEEEIPTQIDSEEENKDEDEDEFQEMSEELVKDVSSDKIDEPIDEHDIIEEIETESELNENEEIQSLEDLLEEEIEDKDDSELEDDIEIKIEDEIDAMIEDDIEHRIENDEDKVEEDMIEDKIEEASNHLFEDEVEEDNSEIEDLEEDLINDNEEPSLFKDEDFKDAEPEREIITNNQEPLANNSVIAGKTSIDMSEILENKNMTKIIENIFDYDMEDFANTIDMISECPTKGEALALLNELFENNNIKPTSKEAEKFKSIISEYFDKV